MHVVMLIYNYYPARVGGAERQCKALAERLVARGHRCTVLTVRRDRQHSAREVINGVEVYRMSVFQLWIDRFLARRKPAPDSRPSRSIRPAAPAEVSGITRFVHRLNIQGFSRSVRRWFARNGDDVDILHVHIADWIAGVAGQVGTHCGIPVVCKGSCMPPLCEMADWVPQRVRLEHARQQLSFIATTGAMVAALAEAGIAADRIYHIPNGVAIPPRRVAVEKNTYILYVGNLTQGAVKGVDVLIRAWARICGAKPETRLIIAGAGDPGPLQQLAEEDGCADQVEFVGFVAEMDDMYNRAGIFVLPSRSEGMSNALLEAMSWGLPPVVSDIPGNRELVQDAQTGLVVPVDDDEALSIALLRLLDDTDLRATLGRQAADHIAGHYSFDDVVDQTLALYRRLKQRGVS